MRQNQLKSLFNNWLPKNWEELDRQGSAVQATIKIGHLNPEDSADPKLVSPSVISQEGNIRTISRGCKTKRGGGWKDFLLAMELNAKSGLVPGLTLAKVEEMRKMITEVTSIKSDFTAALSVAQLKDKKTAKTQFEGRLKMSEQGLDVQVPGMPEGTKLMDLLKSDFMKNRITKEQIKQVEKASKDLKKSLKSSNVNFKKGNYLGMDAIYIETKASKRTYTMLLVDNFLIFGSILEAANLLPSGKTQCDSLTNFKTKTTKEEIDGKIEITKELYPAKSTYAKEGYLHREEVEDMISAIIKRVKNM